MGGERYFSDTSRDTEWFIVSHGIMITDTMLRWAVTVVHHCWKNQDVTFTGERKSLINNLSSKKGSPPHTHYSFTESWTIFWIKEKKFVHWSVYNILTFFHSKNSIVTNTDVYNFCSCPCCVVLLGRKSLSKIEPWKDFYNINFSSLFFTLHVEYVSLCCYYTWK